MPSSCRRRFLLALFLCAGGCTVDVGLGGDETPTRTYWLAPPDVSVDVHPGRVEVTAVPGLDTERMLALDADNRLIPYAGARWNGPIPRLVGSLADRALGARSGEGVLRLEVRRFFVERDGATEGVAAIELAAWHPLDGAAGPQVVAARAPLEEARLGAVAAAFQQALDEVMTDLAGWLRETP
jgi:ABC-type uncharacterized transport system auxiliary subunit